MATDNQIHPTAVVDQPCIIGNGTRIWHFSHICKGATIGEGCSLGQNTFVAGGVVMGDRVKAPELLRLGLISECVSDDSVVERCNEIAATIAGYPAGAAIAIKQSLVAQRGIDSPEDFFPQAGNSALNTAKMLKD